MQASTASRRACGSISARPSASVRRGYVFCEVLSTMRWQRSSNRAARVDEVPMSRARSSPFFGADFMVRRGVSGCELDAAETELGEGALS